MVVSAVRHSFLLAIIGGLSLGVPAQQVPPAQAPPPAATGSVSGTVIAQDTQKPVRFAQVQLQSVASAANTQGRFGGGPGGGGFGGGGQFRTEADGTFLATNVTAGDYYVTATAPGYIPEHDLLMAQISAGADAAASLASLPIVHVAADSTSSINVDIERGGTVSGRAVWEDGTPASGLNVSVRPSVQSGNKLPAPLQGLYLDNDNGFAGTDDRGAFRVSGLASGDYLVTTQIQSRPRFNGGGGNRGPQFSSTITVYSPGVFRRSAAKAVSVRAGDERADLRIVVDLRSLRTVSGHVTSSNASLNIASGRVSLVDPNDTTLHLQSGIDANGSFSVRYVPPGNYTLQISNASTQILGGRGRDRNSGSTTPAVNFQQFSQPIVVTDADLSGFAATLTPTQTSPQ